MASRLKDTEVNKNHKEEIESLNNELRFKNDELELSRIREKTHKEVVDSLLLRICDLNCKLCQKKKHKQGRYQIKTQKQRKNQKKNQSQKHKEENENVQKQEKDEKEEHDQNDQNLSQNHKQNQHKKLEKNQKPKEVQNPEFALKQRIANQKKNLQQKEFQIRHLEEQLFSLQMKNRMNLNVCVGKIMKKDDQICKLQREVVSLKGRLESNFHFAVETITKLQKEIVLLKERLESNFHLAVETITILRKEIKLRNQKLDKIKNTKEPQIPKTTKNRDPQIKK